MDQGGRILHCLEHTLSAHAETIKAAESQLAIEAQQPGYGAVLCRIILANDVSVHLRQLAAVLLKQYVKQHWVEGERGFQSPETSEQEKQQIRQSLPMGLRDADSKIRTAVGVAIAAIANWDWPQAWPGLMEFVVNSIKERIDPNLSKFASSFIGLLHVSMLWLQFKRMMFATPTEVQDCSACSLLFGIWQLTAQDIC